MLPNQTQPPKKILIVEDDPLHQMVMAALLEQVGYPFDLAVDGKSALELVAANKYILILMDIGLPDLSGTQVSEQIRAQGLCMSNIPIVAVTAHSAATMKAKCIQSGMNDFITKPLSSERLQQVIATYVA